LKNPKIHNYTTVFVLFALILLSFAIYLPSLSVGFLSDDWGFNYQIETYGWKAFLHNFNDPFFIPLSHGIATFFYYIFDGNPIGFHVLQILIHGIIAGQLYLLLLQLGGNKNFRYALLSGILFIVFPFHTEAVVWLAAKSYGYALLFMLFSLRAYVAYLKRNLSLYFWLFVFGTLAAIHCKELGYLTPVFAYLLGRWFFQKHKQHLLLYGTLFIFLLSVLIRYYALGVWLGGYGEDVHLPKLTTLLLHWGVWLIKLFGGTRFWFMGRWYLLIGGGIMGVLIYLLLTTKYSITSWFRFLLILSFCLLPIVSLEITAYKSIEAERYGYLASLVMATGLAYLIVQRNNNLRWFLSFFLMLGCIISIQMDMQKYKKANEISTLYLEQLAQIIDKEDQQILLLNVPDNYEGAYVLRNGIESYLKITHKKVAITAICYETFTNQNKKSNDCLVQNNELAPPHQKKYYWIDKNGNKQFNKYWSENDLPNLTTFDKVFYFCNNHVIEHVTH
jgi:protein O-mannosyl-transferase